MKYAGSDSWQIRLSEWDGPLETALWIRAAERIDVPVGGVVTMPLDLDELPTPSPTPVPMLAEAWLHFWNELVFRPPMTEHDARSEMARLGPPEFDVLADYPDFRRLVSSRWPEAHAWHCARKKGGSAMRFDPANPHLRPDIEGAVVRAVEAEIGRTAAPFSIHITVLPVAEDLVRLAGHGRYLVPERVRRSPAYETWLTDVIRELA